MSAPHLSDIPSRLAELERRVQVLECAKFAYSGLSPIGDKKSPAPRVVTMTARPVPDEIIDARRSLWLLYVYLRTEYGMPEQTTDRKVRKFAFVIANNLNPSEFSRWFARRPCKQIADGCTQDRNIRRALTDAISEIGREIRLRRMNWSGTGIYRQ
jgi:hypothetical protein